MEDSKKQEETVVHYTPGQHQIADTPFADFMRRYMNDPELFTYRHAISGNWMLAVWRKKGRIMVELANLGRSPEGSVFFRDMVSLKSRRSRIGNAMRAAFKEHLRTDAKRHLDELEEDQANEMELRAAIRRGLAHKKRDWNDPYFHPLEHGKHKDRLIIPTR